MWRIWRWVFSGILCLSIFHKTLGIYVSDAGRVDRRVLEGTDDLVCDDDGDDVVRL